MNSGTIAGLTSAPLKTKGWNLVQKTATSSGTVSWKSGLGAISQILGPIDQGLTLKTPNASAANPLIAKPIFIAGGDSFLTSTGLEYGGAITIAGGVGYSGGTVIVKGGNSGGIGGTITCAGSRGAGGNVTIEGGLASAYTTQGGSVFIKSGAPNYGAGATPGNISIAPADGWRQTGMSMNDQQSSGGTITLTLGAGGSTINAAVNGNGATGANGGLFSVIGGKGGDSVGSTADTQTGGVGSVISITSGIGGSASGAGAGLRVGGKSGSITISTGQAGSGTNTNGDSGSITISTGLAGAGAGSAGVSGSILFNTGSTNQITISPARTTITNEAKIERAVIVLNSNSTTATLNINDAGTIINCTSSTDFTINLPSTAMPVGYNLMVIQSGTGKITFAANTNTLNSFGGLVSTAGIHSAVSLVCTASQVYNLSGNLV